MSDLTLVATRMTAGGAALSRDGGGRVVFVEGALPGERVVARFTETRRDYARAVVVEVVDASPDRVDPPCAALAAGCGGCPWQHVSPAAQPPLKAGIVADALRRIAGLADPPEARPVATGLAALRTTARLAVSGAGRAGHRPRRGRPVAGGVVETESCRAAHPLLEDLVVNGRYPAGGEVLLRVSASTGDRLVRVTGGAGGLLVPPDVTVVEGGRPGYVHEEVGGRRFRISADSFFQSGPAVAGALAACVREAAAPALGPGRQLVDAYAGVGLFGSVLGAATGARVTAVESSPAAVADARVNLADLDARVVAAEVGRWRPGRSDPRADVVVADPPRPGLGRPGVAAVAAAGAGVVLLVSCDPASMARDARLLAREGYRLADVALVDAFPDTFHVETVSRFER